jgi:hypothetical protein
MPKGQVTTDDPHGSARHSIDYPSEQAATDDAQRSLADMAKDTLPDGKRARFKVRVEDQAGEEVYRGSLDFQGHGREKREGTETTS